MSWWERLVDVSSWVAFKSELTEKMLFPWFSSLDFQQLLLDFFQRKNVIWRIFQQVKVNCYLPDFASNEQAFYSERQTRKTLKLNQSRMCNLSTWLLILHWLDGKNVSIIFPLAVCCPCLWSFDGFVFPLSVITKLSRAFVLSQGELCHRSKPPHQLPLFLFQDSNPH